MKVEGIREKMGRKEAPAAKGGKGKKGAAKAGKKAPAAEEKKKDQFGFREGSKASLFAKMIVDAGKTGTTMEAVKKARPAAAKGTFIRRVTLTSTMGPGIKIDPIQAQSMEVAL